MRHRLRPRIIAELASMIAEVTSKGSPTSRVRKAATEDSVGPCHVSRMPQDRADVGLVTLAGAECHNSDSHARRSQNLADKVARLAICLLGGRRHRETFSPLPIG